MRFFKRSSRFVIVFLDVSTVPICVRHKTTDATGRR